MCNIFSFQYKILFWETLRRTVFHDPHWEQWCHSCHPNKSSLLRNTDRFKQSQKSSFLSPSLILFWPSLLTLVRSFPLARKVLKESATHFRFELCLENQPLCIILNPYTVWMLHAYSVQTLTEFLNFFIHQRICMMESYISLEREIRLLIE